MAASSAFAAAALGQQASAAGATPAVVDEPDHPDIDAIAGEAHAAWDKWLPPAGLWQQQREQQQQQEQQRERRRSVKLLCCDRCGSVCDWGGFGSHQARCSSAPLHGCETAKAAMEACPPQSRNNTLAAADAAAELIAPGGNQDSLDAAARCLLELQQAACRVLRLLQLESEPAPEQQLQVKAVASYVQPTCIATHLQAAAAAMAATASLGAMDADAALGAATTAVSMQLERLEQQQLQRHAQLYQQQQQAQRYWQRQELLVSSVKLLSCDQCGLVGEAPGFHLHKAGCRSPGPHGSAAAKAAMAGPPQSPEHTVDAVYAAAELIAPGGNQDSLDAAARCLLELQQAACRVLRLLQLESEPAPEQQLQVKAVASYVQPTCIATHLQAAAAAMAAAASLGAMDADAALGAATTAVSMQLERLEQQLQRHAQLYQQQQQAQRYWQRQQQLQLHNQQQLRHGNRHQHLQLLLSSVKLLCCDTCGHVCDRRGFSSHLGKAGCRSPGPHGSAAAKAAMAGPPQSPEHTVDAVYTAAELIAPGGQDSLDAAARWLLERQQAACRTLRALQQPQPPPEQKQEGSTVASYVQPMCIATHLQAAAAAMAATASLGAMDADAALGAATTAVSMQLERLEQQQLQRHAQLYQQQQQAQRYWQRQELLVSSVKLLSCDQCGLVGEAPGFHLHKAGCRSPGPHGSAAAKAAMAGPPQSPEHTVDAVYAAAELIAPGGNQDSLDAAARCLLELQQAACRVLRLLQLESEPAPEQQLQVKAVASYVQPTCIATHLQAAAAAMAAAASLGAMDADAALGAATTAVSMQLERLEQQLQRHAQLYQQQQQAQRYWQRQQQLQLHNQQQLRHGNRHQHLQLLLSSVKLLCCDTCGHVCDRRGFSSHLGKAGCRSPGPHGSAAAKAAMAGPPQSPEHTVDAVYTAAELIAPGGQDSLDAAARWLLERQQAACRTLRALQQPQPPPEQKQEGSTVASYVQPMCIATHLQAAAAAMAATASLGAMDADAALGAATTAVSMQLERLEQQQLQRHAQLYQQQQQAQRYWQRQELLVSSVKLLSCDQCGLVGEAPGFHLHKAGCRSPGPHGSAAAKAAMAGPPQSPEHTVDAVYAAAELIAPGGNQDSLDAAARCLLELQQAACRVLRLLQLESEPAPEQQLQVKAVASYVQPTCIATHLQAAAAAMAAAASLGAMDADAALGAATTAVSMQLERLEQQLQRHAQLYQQQQQAQRYWQRQQQLQLHNQQQLRHGNRHQHLQLLLSSVKLLCCDTCGHVCDRRGFSSHLGKAGCRSPGPHGSAAAKAAMAGPPQSPEHTVDAVYTAAELIAPGGQDSLDAAARWLLERQQAACRTLRALQQPQPPPEQKQEGSTVASYVQPMCIATHLQAAAAAMAPSAASAPVAPAASAAAGRLLLTQFRQVLLNVQQQAAASVEAGLRVVQQPQALLQQQAFLQHQPAAAAGAGLRVVQQPQALLQQQAFLQHQPAAAAGAGLRVVQQPQALLQQQAFLQHQPAAAAGAGLRVVQQPQALLQQQAFLQHQPAAAVAAAAGAGLRVVQQPQALLQQQAFLQHQPAAAAGAGLRVVQQPQALLQQQAFLQHQPAAAAGAGLRVVQQPQALLQQQAFLQHQPAAAVAAVAGAGLRVVQQPQAPLQQQAQQTGAPAPRLVCLLVPVPVPAERGAGH